MAITVALGLTVGSAALADVWLQHEPAPLRGATPTFRVRGSVKGMYPGLVKRMRLRVKNPFGFAIKVKVIRVRVRRPYPGCPAKALSVKPWRGRLKIRPHAKRSVRVRVRMRASAPNACQGARFPLRYTGRAVRA